LWPGIIQEVSRYISVCSVCAISKTPHHLPEGKLIPLPIRPWSHIRIDFVTDLAPSDFNTCILVISSNDRSITKNQQVNTTKRPTYCTWVSRIPIPPHLSSFWTAWGNSFRPWSPDHIPSLVLLLPAAVFLC